jgi:ribosomal protein S18 acetylase RimI-like enzyme
MDVYLNIPVSIRSYGTTDDAACQWLYRNEGKVAENDTGCDIENISAAYMKAPGNHLWVAQTTEGQVVGMIGVQQHDEGVGEIRRLRVAKSYRRRGIGGALMEAALRFCQERQYLKVKLDTFMDEEAAIRLFEKFKFQHDRTRTHGEKQLMYFYRDLYSGERAV